MLQTESCHMEDLSTQNARIFTKYYSALHHWITHILLSLAVTAGLFGAEWGWGWWYKTRAF